MLVANSTQSFGFFASRMAVDVVIADPDARMTPISSLTPGIETLPS